MLPLLAVAFLSLWAAVAFLVYRIVRALWHHLPSALVKVGAIVCGPYGQWFGAVALVAILLVIFGGEGLAAILAVLCLFHFGLLRPCCQQQKHEQQQSRPRRRRPGGQH